MKAYKVLNKIDDKLYSTNWSSCGVEIYRKLGLVLEYKLGELIRPKIKGSRLFICSTLEHARQLAGPNNQIWEVKANGFSKQDGYPSYTEPRFTTEGIASTWRDGMLVSCGLTNLMGFDKAYFCTALRLVKRVI